MNEKYTKEVFNFFTENQERFITMGKIAQHEPNVRKELIEGFWKKLKARLKKKFEKENWSVKFSDDFTVSHNKIMIYREEWPRHYEAFPLITVAFEHLLWRLQPFIGILVFYDNKEYDIEGIKNLMRSSKEFSDLGIDKKGKWYPIRRDTSLSLMDYDRLVDILPEKEEKTMNSLEQEAIRYAEVLDDFMNANDNLKEYRIG